MLVPERTVLPNPTAVAELAVGCIGRAAETAIATRGAFHLVLAGGSTPELTYQLLAKEDQQWQYWHLYFGDERCLPIEHPARNSRMVFDSLIANTGIPDAQIHPIQTELGAELAAEKYQQLLLPNMPFDMVLLGMGEDGHTASLFPAHEVAMDRWVIAVHDAPKPPADRVSLTPKALGDSRALLFLVTGENKQDAIRRWRNGETLPVNSISTKGEVKLLVDQAAWFDDV